VALVFLPGPGRNQALPVVEHRFTICLLHLHSSAEKRRHHVLGSMSLMDGFWKISVTYLD
jgi:hypothetical protein